MTRPRALRFGLVLLALVYVAAHVAALFTDAVNWDEFASLWRTQETLHTGVIQGGGRPGLATLPLIPFVDGCSHVMHVAHTTRLLWALVTFALLGGLFELLRRSTRDWRAAALGVATLALVPVFMRWSLQVRTDQPAVACVLWAGVALYSPRRVWWPAAGALVTLGYLCSQKALYVVVLVALIHAGTLYVASRLDWRHELKRLALVVAGALAMFTVHHLVMPLIFDTPRVTSVGQGLDLFRFYRTVLRFRLYRDIVPTVIPQVVLVVAIFASALRAFRRKAEPRKPLLVALVILVAGFGIARFHTASFPYFWITIGLFPAAAIAIGWSGIRDTMPKLATPLAIAAVVLMLVVGIRYRVETLENTQAPQHASLDLAERLPVDWRGFNTDGALLCRADPDPFPVFLGQHITQLFMGPHGSKYTAEFVHQHFARPIRFLVRTNRVGFPRDVKTFWDAHYVPYAGSLWLAGQSLRGAAHASLDVELVADGTYRWRSDTSVSIDGIAIAPQATVVLAAGHHTVTLDSAGEGMLVLDIPEPPAAITPFYDVRPIRELSGVRRQWW